MNTFAKISATLAVILAGLTLISTADPLTTIGATLCLLAIAGCLLLTPDLGDK